MLKIRIEPAQLKSGQNRQKQICVQILTIGKNFELSRLNPIFEKKTRVDLAPLEFFRSYFG